MTTNEYIRGVKMLDWQPFNKKLWQRNYWEHIIRNDNAHQRIANYITNNYGIKILIMKCNYFLNSQAEKLVF